MDNTVAMHVLQAACNLVGYHLYPLFSHVEISSLKIIKEICASHVLKHDEVVGCILKQVNQSNYVLVLTNL